MVCRHRLVLTGPVCAGVRRHIHSLTSLLAMSSRACSSTASRSARRAWSSTISDAFAICKWRRWRVSVWCGAVCHGGRCNAVGDRRAGGQPLRPRRAPFLSRRTTARSSSGKKKNLCGLVIATPFPKVVAADSNFPEFSPPGNGRVVTSPWGECEWLCDKIAAVRKENTTPRPRSRAADVQ